MTDDPSPATPARRQRMHETILARLLVPVFAVMILQSLLYMVLFWRGNVIAHADRLAYDMLTERTAGRRQSLESEMLRKWSDVRETELSVLGKLRRALAESRASVSDIGRDAEFNARLVKRLVPDLLYMLRKNMVTGAFVVLDGPGLKSDPTGSSRAGYYLRDLDPSNYSINNTDIMVERGMPDISKLHKLTFDAYWQPAFSFSGEDDPDARFFFAPLNAARAHGSKESELFGYWSPGHRLGPADIRVISYSIPLILDGGQVIGVLGVDITESYLLSLLNTGEPLPGARNAYYLGVTRDGDRYRRVGAVGALWGALGSPEALTLGDGVHGPTRVLEGAPGDLGQTLGCVQDLNLYHINTPFHGEQWSLIAVVERDELLSFSTQIFRAALFITALALVMGLVAVAIASRMVTSPITSVLKDLRQSDPNQPLALKKLGIREIDELTGSIEALSESVAESSSKISKILSMTKASIGVFEYDDGADRVFVSDNLFQVMGLPDSDRPAGADCFIPRALFDQLMDGLALRLVDPREQIYKIESGRGGTHWVGLTLLKENGKTLGAVSDVTRDVLAKQQIEYERDYDLLTNLYNRRAFHQKLSELFTSGRDLKFAALIMWDLDNLKYVNDTYGHECGDRYIIALSECLTYFSAMAMGNAVSARRSGDEFYTLLYGFDSIEQGRAAIRKGWNNLKRQSFFLPGNIDYGIRVSGGIAWYKRDADTWQELLHYADHAMYHVKHNRKGRLNEFDKADYLSDTSVIYGMEAFNKLIDYSLVKYAFQPVLSAADGSVYGYELQMRPQVSEFKTRKDVLRLAQAQGKLYQLERITWFGAMAAFAERAARGDIAPGQRALIPSITGQALSKEDADQFARQYAPYLDRIVLEVDESEAEDVARKAALVKDWAGMIAVNGCDITGNCESLMIALSPGLIKLDASLVRGADQEDNRQDMLSSIIGYARLRDAQVVAEGVETELEMKLLVRLGVDLLQGNYIGRPAFEIQPIAESVLSALRETSKDLNTPA